MFTSVAAAFATTSTHHQSRSSLILVGSRTISRSSNGFTRISTELFNLVSNDDATAAELWNSLQQLFQDNSDARINALHIELRTTAQGDSPVTVFCQRIKAIGDELRELGDPVSYRALINTLLVGLHE
jgi:hypothetical protein